MAGKRRYSGPLPIPLDVLRPIAGKRREGTVDRRDLDVFRARLATRQHGVLSRAQLAALGYTTDEIDYDAAVQRIIRIHQGVYAVGHEAVSDRGRMIAALLATGPHAAISHETAAHLWSLIPSMPQLIHVTLTDRAPRRRHGIRDTRNRATARDHHPPRHPRHHPPPDDRAAAGSNQRPSPSRSPRQRPHPTHARRPRRAEPQRARARPPPRAPPSQAPPTPIQRPRPRPRGRLPLARPPRDRRDRRLVHARAPPRLRVRPRPRCRADRRRLRRPPLHLAPGDRRHGARDRPHRADAPDPRDRSHTTIGVRQFIPG